VKLVGRIPLETGLDLHAAAKDYAITYHGAKVVQWTCNGDQGTFCTTKTGKTQYVIERARGYYEIHIKM